MYTMARRLLLVLGSGAALNFDAFTRRQAITTSTAALLTTTAIPPLPCSASTKGGVQWSIDVPDSFAVQQQLASIVRVKVNSMFQADDPSSGASIKLLLLPFGQQAGGSLNSDEQLIVAKHFFDATPDADGPKNVATTMATSASRSPNIQSLSRFGGEKGYSAADGARYVQYRYESSRCSEPLDDGECFGSSSKRKTLATVAMSSLSQYRTNTERERMQALGQERNVQVLWLLTLTAPADAWPKLEPQFEGIANSFVVPLKPKEAAS